MSTVNGGWRGPNIVKDGLVLYLDPGSPNSYFNKTGVTIKDISGNNISGTLSSPIYDNNSGGSLLFDGLDDIVNLGTNPIGSINNYNSLSFSFWFKALSITNNGNLFSWGDNSGVRCRLSVGAIQFLDRGGTNSWYSTVIVVNTWYNVTITLSTTNGCKTYINGVINVNNVNNFVPNMASGVFVLGRRGLALPEPYYGYMSSFCTYNKVLSESEVLQNYNALKGRYGL